MSDDTKNNLAGLALLLIGIFVGIVIDSIFLDNPQTLYDKMIKNSTTEQIKEWCYDEQDKTYNRKFCDEYLKRIHNAR